MVRRPRPKAPASPSEETFTWMVRLAERLARRDRLRELAAPESILEAELDLVERAKGELSPEQVLFVLRRRDELIRYFEPARAGDSPPSDKATDPS
jgi:hypothetical protein